MDVVQTINSLLGPVSKLFAWLQNRANPVRQQAARILQAFEADQAAETRQRLF